MDLYKVKQFLHNDPDYAIELARDINCFNGSFPEFDFWNFDELVDSWDPDNIKELMLMFADAVKHKQFDNFSVFVFDSCGELYMATMEDLRELAMDELDEIIDNVVYLYPRIEIYNNDFDKLLETAINESEMEE